MMNMILRFHKFFICCYIDDIVIFSKTLKNHLKHLNTVFSLFDKMRITLKKVKTHLNYSSIILLSQQVDDFDMTSSKKQITALLHEDSTAEQTRKNYSKKTSIFNVSELEKETFKFIQKIFDDFNFLHHQNFNQQLYVDLNV